MEQDIESGKLVGSMYGVVKNPFYSEPLLVDSKAKAAVA